MAQVVSTPAPGIASLNDVRGNGLNVDITSNDGSVVITPNQSTRTVDLSTTIANPGVVLEDIPCDSSVFIGAWVRMDSAGKAWNALADSEANSNVMGVVEYKSSSILATIRVSGATSNIFTGLDPSKDYVLSDMVPGTLTLTIPIASGSVILRLGQPLSSTRFVVQKGTRIIRA